MALTRSGRTLQGPDGPVRVKRTEGGVLHVHAETAAGRAFGLGWGHAQDRIIQLDLLRIAGRGEVAARLTGSDASFAQDLFIRKRGFWHAAVQQSHALTPGARTIARAYGDGINRWLSQHRRPWELWGLRVAEQDWQPADSILVGLLQSYLGLAQSQEVAERFIVQVARSGDSQDVATLRALFAPHLDALDVALLADVTLEPLDLPIDPQCASAFRSLMASNAYAIPPGRSASGHALVGGEPHLDTTQLPPYFYEAVLTGPDTIQAGVTIPGLPGVISGRWTHVAAAVTYGFVDQIDYFVEEVEAGQIRRGDAMVDLEPVRETVERKGGPSEDIVLWRADGRLLQGDPSRPERQRVLGLQWALDGRGMDELFTLPFALETAADVDAARAVVSRFPQSLQFALGDVHGNTGLQQGGYAPQRAEGHSGLNPQAGWDRSRWWREDPVPHGALYGLTQRPDADAILVTANETTNPEGGPVVVNLGLATDRRDRIAEVLNAHAAVDHAALRAVHRDRASLSTARLLDLVRPYLPANRAGHILRAWDGRFDPESEAPSLFERFRATWLMDVYGPLFDRARAVCAMPTEELVGDVQRAEDLPTLWSESNSVTTNVPSFEQSLLDPDAPALAGRDWESTLRSALARALAVPAQRWGRANSVRRSWFVIASAPPWLSRSVSCTVAVPGAMDSPEQGRIHRIAGHVATVAPVYRLIAPLERPVIYTALCGGPGDRLISLPRQAELRRFARYELKELPLTP